jgi:hypothetical protein
MTLPKSPFPSDSPSTIRRGRPGVEGGQLPEHIHNRAYVEKSEKPVFWAQSIIAQLFPDLLTSF